MNWKRIVVCTISLVATVWATGLWAADPPPSSGKASGNASTEGLSTEIRLPATGEMQEVVQPAFNGMVVPARRVTVSAPLSGVLMHLHIKEGQLVEEGEVLAELDHRAAQAAVQVATLRAENRAPVRHAKSTLEFASLQLHSVTQAHKASAGSEFELRQAKLKQKQARSAYEMAVNKREIAEAALKFEQQKHARYIVRAPFSGRVVRVFVQPGAMLRVSEQMVKMITLKTLEATVQMPVTLFGKLEIGQEYSLIADEPVAATLEATLKSIDPVIDSIRGTFRCVFTIANEDEALPAGFAVRLDTEGLLKVSPDASADAD